jgi:hypothetical protein
VTPDAFGLIEQKLESKSRRRLVLIAKVLQNLANEAYFEQKEEYMKCSNVFIESNLGKMHSFFDSLVVSQAKSSLQPCSIVCLHTSDRRLTGEGRGMG